MAARIVYGELDRPETETSTPLAVATEEDEWKSVAKSWVGPLHRQLRHASQCGPCPWLNGASRIPQRTLGHGRLKPFVTQSLSARSHSVNRIARFTLPTRESSREDPENLPRQHSDQMPSVDLHRIAIASAFDSLVGTLRQAPPEIARHWPARRRRIRTSQGAGSSSEVSTQVNWLQRTATNRLP